MIVFLVPVKSKQLSSDWGSFSKLVERTLGSVCQQTDNDFKVIAICHEAPDTDFVHKNLEFIYVNFEPPKLVEGEAELNNSLKEKDKALKIKAGIEVTKKHSPDFYMVVDSDDCISKKIAKYVNAQNPKTSGWYMKKGYFYREGQRFAFLNTESFNRFCGTSLILNANIIDKMFIESPMLSFNHKVEPQSLGLAKFPFPAALYSMGNGENHAMSIERMEGLLKKPKKSISSTIKSLISKVKKYRPQPLSGRFKKQFNFYGV